jgi:peptide/nickel transport system permease protein
MLATAPPGEATLSFLALGVQLSQASWGGMLAHAYNYIEIAPAQMYVPGLAILFTALVFNALGESLRVALDPTMKRRETRRHPGAAQRRGRDSQMPKSDLMRG